MTESQNKKNYIDLMKKIHQHPETKQWLDQELRHPYSKENINIFEKDTDFRCKYETQEYAMFQSNPRYGMLFPKPSQFEPWTKEEIIQLSDPPFEEFYFIILGQTILKTDCRIQSLLQSLRCGGYYNLRKKLSDIFIILRHKFRKIEADIIVSYLAKLHGFQCHCLAKIYCANCPQSYREVLSKISINEKLPILIDFKTQFGSVYYKTSFLTVKKADKEPEKWSYNLKKAIKQRNLRKEAIETEFFSDFYQCFNILYEVLDSGNMYSRDTIEYHKEEWFHKKQQYWINLNLPTTRVLIFLPLLNGKRQIFEKLMLQAEKIQRCLFYEESLLLAETTGDWFQIILCKNNDEKLIMQCEDQPQRQDDANCVTLDSEDAECCIEISPPLQNINIFIYTERWNIMQSNYVNTAPMFF